MDTPLDRDLINDIAGYTGSWIDFQRENRKIPGVQVAIRHEDRIVFSAGYGYADLEQQVPVTTSTRFRVASHSKMLTVVALMHLREQGKLRLDDPVHQWVDNLPQSMHRCAIRELMGHQAGIARDGQDGDYWQLSSPFPTDHQLAHHLGQHPAIYPSNTQFKYSNTGYALLGQVIAKVSGTSYSDCLRQIILQPVGLSNTTSDYTPDQQQYLATGYTSQTAGVPRRPIDHINTGIMASATGAISTANDLCRFAATMFDGVPGVISEESRRLLQRTESHPAGSENHYGLGIQQYKVGNRVLWGHGGGFPGFLTQTLWDPRHQLAISVLTNSLDASAADLALSLFRLLELAEKDESTWHRHHTHTSHPISRQHMDRWSGRYANMWDVLDVIRLGQRAFTLWPHALDPASGGGCLRFLDATHAVIPAANGFASIGEVIELHYDGEKVQALHGPCISTYLPYEDFKKKLQNTKRLTAGWNQAPREHPAHY